ncbi:hypothetical protein CU044_5169 [Streptomyces sp. L-9-10]|nr:hypothetical protein CU044_5169 [Streptomyces sp. L-9-10]
MAGEPEAAALGVAQSHALHRRCGRRAFGLSLAQWFFSSVRAVRGDAPPSDVGVAPGPGSVPLSRGDLGCGVRAGDDRCTTQSTRTALPRFPALGRTGPRTAARGARVPQPSVRTQ